jgi:hypothetical protein
MARVASPAEVFATVSNHLINLTVEADNTDPYKYWAYLTLSNGESAFVYFYPDDVALPHNAVRTDRTGRNVYDVSYHVSALPLFTAMLKEPLSFFFSQRYHNYAGLRTGADTVDMAKLMEMKARKMR